MSLFTLTNKVAIVTGSGYGLGKHMALGLAAAGAKVILCGRSQGPLKQTQAEITTNGGEAEVVQFDATNQADCQRLIDATIDHYQKLDVMVINHGTIAVSDPQDTQAKEWQQILNVNLTSCFYCAQAAGQQMIQQNKNHKGQGGSIIMVSSNGSLVSFDGLAAYGASKGGVDQLCRQLASEWGKYNIRVNTINPGYTENPMGGRPKSTVTPALEQEIKTLTPLGRRGRVEEFVGPVVFLASEAASYVSGHSLTVDGGYCAR